MTFSLLTLLALAPSAFAADSDYTVCTGKTGAAMQLCRQGVDLAATKRQLEALEATCSQVCDNSTPAAPAAPSAPRSTGPSRTYLVLDAYGKRLDALEAGVADGTVSEDDFDREIKAINDGIAGINTTLDDHERRLDELERKADNPPLATPPIYVAGPAGADGADGEDGRDGEDGLPAEITVTAGIGGLHSSEVSLVGLELDLRVGGRPTRYLGLGGYGEGFLLGANDLGFGVGGYLDYEVASWFAPGVQVGWHEVGLDLTTAGARRVVQGVEATVTLEFRPTRIWVIGGDLGAHFSGEGTAFVWGVNTGIRF